MKVRLKLCGVGVLAAEVACFNSMKVRLKPYTAAHSTAASTKFQFHEGPIKTHMTARTESVLVGFNSMKVRLKPVIKMQCLKSNKQFQFHEGPIKTHR